jgi:precorrin-8X/cobalt-precorrin-8 methylmutase
VAGQNCRVRDIFRDTAWPTPREMGQGSEAARGQRRRLRVDSVAAMPLFDCYIAVDWSANNTPKAGKDSIWACVGTSPAGDLRAVNHRTRRAAETWLLEQLEEHVARAERILVGLDFPYGYPNGFARALGFDGESWLEVWAYLARQIEDDAGNASNRFAVAAEINRQLGTSAPFWGRPSHLPLPALPVRKDVMYSPGAAHGLPEWRQVEQHLRRLRTSPQPAWKLAGAGAVGSQSLVGIPVLHRLRRHIALREVSQVWPFEVLHPNLPAGAPAIIHAEIWPSIVPFALEAGTCRDEQQVRAVVRHWQRLDEHDQLGELFALAADCEEVRREEGWVLGVPSSGELPAISARRHQAPRAQRTAAPPHPTIPALRAACLCGCGGHPRGRRSRFMPGHDQRIDPATGRRFNAH